MKQETLVNRAIDVMIHGHQHNGYHWIKVLGDKRLRVGIELWFARGGLCLDYMESERTRYPIYFDKKVKNMAMLVMLVRDWSNKNNNNVIYEMDRYTSWIKDGVPI